MGAQRKTWLPSARERRVLGLGLAAYALVTTLGTIAAYPCSMHRAAPARMWLRRHRARTEALSALAHGPPCCADGDFEAGKDWVPRSEAAQAPRR